MFLLLWLQTIPSQTALSGANPISRRIAELSGCVGVCAHGRTAGSQWEQAMLPTASLSSPALQGPRKQSRQVLGETASRKPSPYFSSPRARGLWEPCGSSLRERRDGHGCSPEGRARAGRQKPRRTGVPPAFPHVPQRCLGNSSCTHTKFLRGRRPNSPQNQNQAELLLYYTEEMRRSSFCIRWLQSMKMAIPPNFGRVNFVLHTLSRKLISVFNG